MSIESSICEAIDIIVEQAVSSASYDKTVRATIVTCTDASTGCYKVKYQDSTFLAYGDIDITYPTGCSVYVLIPGNDMSADKRILGTVTKLGEDYIAIVEPDQRYEIVGSNVINSNDFSLSSYKSGTQNIILYSKDNSETNNKISLDKDITYEYLTNSNSIICGANFRTALPVEQQYQGNYGICFALDFLDNTENNIVTRYYVVDVNNMTGQPYNLVSKTRQYDIFDIDSDNFKEVNFISIFCYNFPKSLPDDECVDDIFITDIELEGANELSDDEINNYSITFITPEGTIFTENSNLESLTIEAQVRIKGNIISNDNQNLSFYWFTEHAGIGNGSPYYCTYGGQGWKCLNNYNIIEGTEDEPAVVEWLPSSSIWVVNKSDIVASTVQYKCAVKYGDIVINNTITIKNLGSNVEITIESDSGTQFYFDNGKPTLTCLVNGQEELSYTYSWSVTTNAGLFTSLSETTVLNDEYNNLLQLYNQWIQDIQEEKILQGAAEVELKELQTELKPFEELFRVEGNKLIHVDISSITNFSTYKCTVYNQEIYLGTASIILVNSYEVDGAYSLVINNGTYVYKYNENGISPASNAVDSPISIKALTFTIYDNLGQAIDDDIAQHCDIEWIVPTSNTLIEIPSDYSPTSIDTINETETFSNLMSFTYTIASRYDISKTRNDIYLIVNYKNTSLSTKTHLTFLKEGESGTNGTEYSLKIVPNPASGDPNYWMIMQDSNNVITHNYTPAAGGQWLKVQFYHNEELIYDGVTSSSATTEGKSLSITWSILQNKYTNKVSDATCLLVNSSTGVFTIYSYPSLVSGSHISEAPANIVQVTAIYDGVTYYNAYPVYYTKLLNNDYNISLKSGTGFRNAMYTSDGQSPKYDNSYPFEIIVTQLIDGYNEDVSTLTSDKYMVTYDLEYLGQIYDSSWVSNINLEDRTVKNLTTNQFAIKPKDSFDGECVTNAIEIIVSHSGDEVGRIHLPIYLYLNRYGLANLNGWDGNSIQISEEGGFILAPQIGAGIKNSDNSFTGLVMGKVKEAGYSDTLVGLVGYNSGERTLVLDSEDGSAVFGATGKGQIIIDPSNDMAVIESGDYKSSNGTKGMQINLSESSDGSSPSIIYGNGNFTVDGNGYLTAKGGGSIAGWHIDDYSLYTGKKDSVTALDENDSSYNVHLSAGTFSRTIGGESRTDLRMAFGSNFGITNDGIIYANQAELNGKIIASSGEVGGWTIGTNSLYNGCSSSTSTTNGIYLGTSYIRQYLNGNYINITAAQLENGNSSGDNVTLGSGTVMLTHNNTYLGYYGTTYYDNEPTKYGLLIDGEYECDFIAFARKRSPDAEKYTMDYLINYGLSTGSDYIGYEQKHILYGDVRTTGSLYTDAVYFRAGGLDTYSLKSHTYEGNPVGISCSGCFCAGGTYYVGNRDYTLHVNGNAYSSGDWYSASDIELKINIKCVENEADTIMDILEPVSFNYKNDDALIHFGITYQNACEALKGAGLDPNTMAMVGTATSTDKEYGAVAYSELIGLLIYEVKQLKQQIKSIKEIK